MIVTRKLSITQLYQDHVEKLKLTWVAAIGVERSVEIKDMETYGPDVVGHLNLIYSHRVQVIGKAEQRWLEQVGEEPQHHLVGDVEAVVQIDRAEQRLDAVGQDRRFIRAPAGGLPAAQQQETAQPGAGQAAADVGQRGGVDDAGPQFG